MGGRGKAASPLQGHLTPLTGRNFNILLVEDNRVNQMVAKTILTKLGFGVDIANNGQEAVESVQSKNTMLS